MDMGVLNLSMAKRRSALLPHSLRRVRGVRARRRQSRLTIIIVRRAWRRRRRLACLLDRSLALFPPGPRSVMEL